MSAPDPDGAGDVGRCDPLAVGRVPGDGGRVSVFRVDSDLEGAIEVPDDDGSAVAVEDGVGLRVAGDEDAPAALRRGDANVRLLQPRQHVLHTREKRELLLI